MRDPDRWICVQLSDPHIVAAGELLFGELDTAAQLAEAVAWIGAMAPAPDLVLVSGDLVNDGRADQYAHLAALLAPLEAPLLLATGNHDAPDALAAAFPAVAPHPDTGRLDVAHDGPVRTVVLDTNVAGCPGGDLTPAQLDWLDRELHAHPDRPTMVALHHPPFATGIDHMDAMALDASAARRLAEVVARHPQVERVVSGHLHRSIFRRWAGTVAVTAPSTAMGVALELRPDGPAGWTPEPPSASIHLWSAGHGMVTHQSPIRPGRVIHF